MRKLQIAKRRQSHKTIAAAIERCEQRIVLSASAGACAAGEAATAAMFAASQADSNGESLGDMYSEAYGPEIAGDEAAAYATAFVEAMAEGEALGGEDYSPEYGGESGDGSNAAVGGTSADSSNTNSLNSNTVVTSNGFEIVFLHADITSAGVEIRGRIEANGNLAGHTITVAGVISTTLTTDSAGEFYYYHNSPSMGLVTFTGGNTPRVYWI